MEKTSMQALLTADEERVRNTLRAGQSVDQSRESGIRALSDELGALLLRYNAAYVDEPERQAVADAMTAAALDGLALLRAGRTELKRSGKQTRLGAPWLLLLALALAAAAVWLLPDRAPFGWGSLALAVLLAFLSGRVWTKEGEAKALSTLDPELLWDTLQNTAGTMDRKLEDFAGLLQARREQEQAASGDAPPLEQAELELLSELLEALYTANGDYALRQLRRLRPFLRDKGLETVDYSADTAELFELMPTKKEAATLRPAILHKGRLLLTGRAAAPME